MYIFPHDIICLSCSLVEGVGGKQMLKTESKTRNAKKSYLSEMNMHDARVNFSLGSRMIDCKMNFSNNPKYKADTWRCDSCCTCVDSQSHILYCSAYQELREGISEL